MKRIGELGMRPVLCGLLLAALASAGALVKADSALPSETPAAFRKVRRSDLGIIGALEEEECKIENAKYEMQNGKR